MRSGIIYIWTNNVNGKVYIGQTMCEHDRYRQHVNASDNYPLHLAMRKNGIDNFSYDIIHRVEGEYEYVRDHLNFWEKFYIKEYQSTDKRFGYNIALGGHDCGTLSGEQHPMYGTHHTDEWKQNVSNKLKGKTFREYKPHTLEARQKISIGNKGKQVSAESRLKISESHKGLSRAAWNKGVPTPQETKLKQQTSANNRVKYKWVTEDRNVVEMQISHVKQHHPNWVKLEN